MRYHNLNWLEFSNSSTRLPMLEGEAVLGFWLVKINKYNNCKFKRHFLFIWNIAFVRSKTQHPHSISVINLYKRSKANREGMHQDNQLGNWFLIWSNELTIPRPSSINPGPNRSDVTCPGSVQTDKATPIVPTSSDACCASAATSARERPAAAAAPATYKTETWLAWTWYKNSNPKGLKVPGIFLPGQWKRKKNERERTWLYDPYKTSHGPLNSQEYFLYGFLQLVN